MSRCKQCRRELLHIETLLVGERCRAVTERVALHKKGCAYGVRRGESNEI